MSDMTFLKWFPCDICVLDWKKKIHLEVIALDLLRNFHNLHSYPFTPYACVHSILERSGSDYTNKILIRTAFIHLSDLEKSEHFVDISSLNVAVIGLIVCPRRIFGGIPFIWCVHYHSFSCSFLSSTISKLWIPRSYMRRTKPFLPDGFHNRWKVKVPEWEILKLSSTKFV